MKRILIVDDHEILRKGLRQMLEKKSDAIFCDEAGTGQEALNKIYNSEFDVVLLDIAMPGIGGLEALKQIKTLAPKLTVLILSMYPEKQYGIRALKAGAAGYLTKGCSPVELIEAIEKVTAGEKYITPSLAGELASFLEKDTEKTPAELLSDREYQVMMQIANGKTINEIAEDLMLSPNTIRSYRERIFIKMNMKTNSEIIEYAKRSQLTF